MRLALALLSLAALACEADRTAAPETTSPHATPARTEPAPTGCSNLDRAEPHGSRIEADVDGDSEPDDVTVLVDRGGPRGCSAFVAVNTGGGELVAPITDEMIAFDLGMPVINTVADIDGRPGAEIVVDIWSGASTGFVGAFGAGGGTLERIEIGGSPSGLDHLFPYGGSVGHLEATDCVDGRIVVSTAAPAGARYLLLRRFFVPDDGRLVHDSSERERVSSRRLQDFPEFVAGAPFASCD